LRGGWELEKNMEEEIKKMFTTMAEQFIVLIKSNNSLMVENLRLMELNKELLEKNGKDNI